MTKDHLLSQVEAALPTLPHPNHMEVLYPMAQPIPLQAIMDRLLMLPTLVYLRALLPIATDRTMHMLRETFTPGM